jgi:hypothetical protein
VEGVKGVEKNDKPPLPLLWKRRGKKTLKGKMEE